MKASSTTLVALMCVVAVLADPSFGQSGRNPVLEYSSGTWCGWCPCGHVIIDNTILPAIPNAIIIGYHGPANGSDPYSYFAGNSIIDAMFGFAGYPSGVVDRTTGVISRSDWFTQMNNRQAISPTVYIGIGKTYNTSTRTLNATIYVQALTQLTGQFMLSLILLEDSLVYPQAGFSNEGCFGSNDYIHTDVVRAMINGERGDTLNTSQTWNSGETISKSYSYTVSAGIVDSRASIVALVYKVGSTLNTSEIQQAKQWQLVGTIIVPVQLASFTATVVGPNSVLVEWMTISEVNNFGFYVQKKRANESVWMEIPNSFVPGHGTTNEPRYYSFTDNNAAEGQWHYRLKQVDLDGTIHFSEPVSVQVLTGVAENAVPDEFVLEQNYPNPFNPSTVITYRLPLETHVSLSVFDLLGKEVARVIDERKAAGSHEARIDATGLPSGVYFYLLKAASFSQTRKMVLVR